MKKPVITLIIILVLLLVFPVYSFFKWNSQPKKTINLLVLDKTVPSLERDEHRSLFRAFIQHRFVKKENKTYSFRKDYFGFFPLTPLRNKEFSINRIGLTDILDFAEGYDGLYYADTYGVYFNDWYQGLSKGRRSRMIYGGLNNNDYLLLKEMNDRNKLVIAEYNTLGFPTSSLERNKTEQIFNIRWTEWIGKYFPNLDTLDNDGLPSWIVNNYKSQNLKNWEYSGPGIVLVNEGGKIVVLENKTHLDFVLPYIYSSVKGMGKFNLPYKVSYHNWFSIVESGENEIISTFKLHVNNSGDSILRENFIPKEFPAVIASVGEKNYYYFAGNFASNPVGTFTARFHNFDRLGLYNLFGLVPGQKDFYYQFYANLVNGILSDYIGSQKE